MLSDILRLSFLFLASFMLMVCFEKPVFAQGSKESFAETYRSYLSREFPADFKSLSVNADEITIEARLPRGKRIPVEQLAIAILPAHVPSHRPIVASQVCEVPLSTDGDLCMASIPRFTSAGQDRCHCRFILVHRNVNSTFVSLTASKYVNNWEQGVQRKLGKLVGRDRKGLGGIPNNSAKKSHQIYNLGLSHATINIVLNGLIRAKPTRGFEKWDFEGRSVYINQRQLVQYDQRLERLREQKIVASMILLVSNQRDKSGKISHTLVHPEANLEGKFAMPNLATPAGAFLYRAIVFHLAERFTREGPTAGRVTNWIMHNEIDQSGIWTTMGDQPIERYIEMFTRSARLVHHVTRQFDPHARVFVSLTHYWNRMSKTKSAYRVRDVIEHFARSSRVEGDFEWGIAYHPYPTNLREPRSWNDKSVRFDFDTPLITPRNIEVLPAYLDQPRLRFLGKHQRPVLLSEQGCSSESMSIEDQKIQAAGIVYMFLRMRQLPTVEAFHYHAYRDHPIVEGGARFGLVDENEKPKFGWKVYRSLNTKDEKSATEFAWSIMGREAKLHANSKRSVITGSN